MVDSDLQTLSQTAHQYSECSNAGVCNRRTGECECQEGFEGVACHRMSCPGFLSSCSGHGVCQSTKQLAKRDSGTVYSLWDYRLVRGCLCDKGFYGGDCSLRRCKSGIDPVYYDDVVRIQYPMFFFTIMTTSATYDISDGTAQLGPGYFSLIVFDQNGHGYTTPRLQAPATCSSIISALEALPNNVIPPGNTLCYRASFNGTDAMLAKNFNVTYHALYKFYFTGTKTYELKTKATPLEAGYISSYANVSKSDPLVTGDIYHLQFYGNPGSFQQPEVNIYTDGSSLRASLQSPGGVLITKSWTNGQQSMDFDYFPDYCKNMVVSIGVDGPDAFLFGRFFPSTLLACLGGSDFNPDNNIVGAGYSYDYGSIYYPHIIKLARTQADIRDGYFLAAVYYDTSGSDIDSLTGVRIPGLSGSIFRIMHPIYPLDNFKNALFNVFTTTGVMQLVQNQSRAEFDFGSNHIYTSNRTVEASGSSFDGDISCEALGTPYLGMNTSEWNCIDKGDLFTIIDPYKTLHNPPFINMYQAKSVRKISPQQAVDYYDVFKNETANQYHKNLITTDLNINWASSTLDTGVFHVYKFTPPYNAYHYFSECSNRGLCNTFEGTCECFGGYTGDACQTQDVIAS